MIADLTKLIIMKKRFVSIVLLTIYAGTTFIFAQQQNPSASFDSEIHDFGIIKEADGIVNCQFIFTNTGGTPLILKNVTASCGCTTPNYSKDPVLPGAKGFINVSFNPQGKSGKFEKQITITSNAEPESQVLYIKGDIIPKPPSIEDMFPNNLDGLRFKKFEFDLGTISMNKIATQSMEVYNSTDKPLKVAFPGVPKHIKIKIMPEVIKPKGKAIIQIEYEAVAKNDWGHVKDYITLNINDNAKPSERKLSVFAYIKEDFSKLSKEQRMNAPKILFENTNFDFGTAKSGEKVIHDFAFKNDGKSNLIIRKSSPSCGCTIANLKTNIIKPGELDTVRIIFNSTGRNGHQDKQVTIITNDPSNPEVIVKISGNIK